MPQKRGSETSAKPELVAVALGVDVVLAIDKRKQVLAPVAVARSVPGLITAQSEKS